MYRWLFSHTFVRMDPERAHAGAYQAIRLMGEIPPVRWVVRMLLARPSAAQRHHVMGVDFPTRLGVAAGFDKEGACVKGLSALGFGFTEIGTVTAQAQPGNETPRLWRITQWHALRNRMGFNNHGARAMRRQLRWLRLTRHGRDQVVGVNLGKTKLTALADAPWDYATSARLLAAYANYLVINVSSPNTPGLRDLQSVESLEPIVTAVRAAADGASPNRHVPLLVKIAPDLADEDIDAVVDLALRCGLDGLVAVNTSIAHSLGEGGLSGPPLMPRGLAVVRRIRQRAGKELAIIGVGGISSPGDARAYLDAGADLVQAYTAFIYGGPAWPGRISRALASGSRSRGTSGRQ